MKRLRATTLLIGLTVGAMTGCSTNDSATDTTQVSGSIASSASPSADSTAGNPAAETPSPAPTITDDEEAPATNAAETPALSTPPPTAVTNVAVEPGQSDGTYVGAAADVTTTTCELDGSSWKMGGKVTNSSGADATYRIYVALNVKGSTETKALVQSDIQVPKGKTSDWSSTADVSDEDLVCILRVERSTAG